MIRKLINKIILKVIRKVEYRLASPTDKQFRYAVGILEREFALRRSMDERVPVDKAGEPLPWYTYPAIDYIKQVNFSDKRIYEFGSGNSSLFWAKIAKEVVSVEHDEKWYTSRLNFRKPNLILKHRKDEHYSASILEEDGEFDVIVVDGVLRDRCCEQALKKLKRNGLLILDNSDRASEFVDYSRAVSVLKGAGFIQVDFCGFGPCVAFTWITSFFFTRKFDFISKNDPIQPVKAIGNIMEK
jgi:hypothetical protein